MGIYSYYILYGGRLMNDKNVPQIGANIIDLSDDKDKGILYDKVRKRAFRLGPKEYQVYLLLSNGDTLENVLKKDIFSYSELTSLMDLFSKMNLFGDYKKSKVNILHYKVGLFYPSNRLQKSKLLKILLKMSNILLIFGVVACLFTIHPRSFFLELRQELSFTMAFWSVVFMSLSLIMHELFHAMEAIKQGAKIAEFGIEIYCGFPVAYTSICDMNSVTAKGKINIAMAGIKSNLITMLWCIVFFNVVSGWGKVIVLEIFIANVFPIIGNIDIFCKFDFYYVVEAIVNEKNLMEKAKQSVVNGIKGKMKEGDKEYLIYGIGVYLNEWLILFGTILYLFQKVIR